MPSLHDQVLSTDMGPDLTMLRRHRSACNLPSLGWEPPEQLIPRPSTAHSWVTRPLSDIREAPESSFPSLEYQNNLDGPYPEPKKDAGEIPPIALPRRSSSRKLNRHRSRKSYDSRRSFDQAPDDPGLGLPPPEGSGLTIPARRKSRSPVRGPIRQRHAISSDALRPTSRTFVRAKKPYDILEYPEIRNSRLGLDVRVSAPLFMGGGAIEGRLHMNIDGGPKGKTPKGKDLSIGRISMDVLGVEEVSNSKRAIFLTLAGELLDDDNPPPATMLASISATAHSPSFWRLTPSTPSLPFQLDLPLNVGPGPFSSKKARIKYLLAVTLLIKVAGKSKFVRQCIEISLISVFDPEKALVSLPSPLVAEDEVTLHHGAVFHTIKLIAGMHRQIWVSGTSLFVDVFIVNDSDRTVKKIELTLERCILRFLHSAASTEDQTASDLRISDEREQKVIGRTVIKAGKHGQWNDVPPHSDDVQTCEVNIPRGHLTVKAGRYFEVRYRLNIHIGSTLSHFVTVQLPVTIIHMNSLDIIPNSLPAVASAIHERQSNHSLREEARTPRSVQGRAFAAPRQRSISQLRKETVGSADIRELEQTLELSPRKHRPNSQSRPQSAAQGRDLKAARGGVRSVRSMASREMRAPPMIRAMQGMSSEDSDAEFDVWAKAQSAKVDNIVRRFEKRGQQKGRGARAANDEWGKGRSNKDGNDPWV